MQSQTEQMEKLYMSNHPDTLSSSGSWYSEYGSENDVVLSTRIRLARNLANFPFPCDSRKDDAERVQALVFDSFSHMDDSDRFQYVSMSQLDSFGIQLFVERAVIPERDCNSFNINAIGKTTEREYPCDLGIVVRGDGRVSCIVNSLDHVRISALASGYEPRNVWQLCHEIDKSMQSSLQFAASYDFGFLTANLCDAGSGMKISTWLMLPALMHANKVKENSELISKQNFRLKSALGSLSMPYASLGACYQLESICSMNGSEEDQITEFTAVLMQLCNAERNARKDFINYKPTILKHLVCRTLAIAKNSKFLECSDAFEIIANLHLALSCGFIEGISYKELHAIMYRIRNSCVDFLRRSSNFIFEDDIKDSVNLTIPRLRALLIQELVEDIKICF